jgi:hypothetical protein
MELNDMIFLAAAAIYATSTYKNHDLPFERMHYAVKQARMLWAEVIKQDKEDS